MNPNAPIPSTPRLCVIILGYLITIAGAFSMFSVPLLATLLIIAAGGLMIDLVSRRDYPAPRHTWRSMLVWIAGSAVIMGVLWLIGEDRVRHWTPHPAGYQIVWFFCLNLFRHLRQIYHPVSSSPQAP